MRTTRPHPKPFGGPGARVYIAGPMRGHDDLNWPAFDTESGRWAARGWRVSNPARHDRQIGIHPGKMLNDALLQTARRWNAQRVLAAQVLALLPGWEQSNGTQMELALAKAADVPVFDVQSESWATVIGGGRGPSLWGGS